MKPVSKTAESISDKLNKRKDVADSYNYSLPEDDECEAVDDQANNDDDSQDDNLNECIAKATMFRHINKAKPAIHNEKLERGLPRKSIPRLRVNKPMRHGRSTAKKKQEIAGPIGCRILVGYIIMITPRETWILPS